MKPPEEEKIEGHDEVRNLRDMFSFTVARVAHELMTPLSGSRNVVHWLRKQWRLVDPGRVDQRLAELEVQLEHMLHLIRNLELLRKGTEAGIEAESPTSLSTVLKSVVETVRFVLGSEERTPIRISISGDDLFPPLKIPSEQLKHVFFNLCHNAVKYQDMKDKPARVDIDCSVECDHLAIRVSDWGIGVPSEWEEAIFEDGVRAPNAIRVNVTGLGIGLFAARSILRQYGGDLILQNSDKPTQFTLILPMIVIWNESAAPNPGPEADG